MCEASALHPFSRCHANVPHHLTQRRSVPERFGGAACTKVCFQNADLGIAEALDRHEGTTATLADHFEHAARLVRQVVPFLRPQT